MSWHINKDRQRVARLWLLNDTMLEISEADWPPSTHGDDRKAAMTWHELTGLKVTIETVTYTTAENKT